VTALLSPVATALEAGLREGIAPALAATVLLRGRIVHASCHGEVPAPGPRPLREDDLFDVASLTKVLATTSVAAQLVAEGALDLDAPVAGSVLRFAQAGKGAVTARHLLAHSSGLPAWRPYFEAVASDPVAGVVFLPSDRRPSSASLGAPFGRARTLVVEAILAEPLEVAPGSRAIYSDPGFIALGLLLEAVAGAPLSALCERRVFRPLGLGSTFFLDGADPDAAAARAAGRSFVPTGASAARREVSQGAVNDDNAWALGGVGGHAGVFSTAREVAAIGQAWLDALDGRPSLIPADAAATFAERDRTPGSERALGWDTPSRGVSSLGSRLGRGPRGALGHLGFTGTSLWIDLDAGLVCALLTNHVHPGGASDRPRIRAFRQRFHDAVAEAIGVA
jgi:CubicO group peptidase (beta-lactamase class C family)